MCVKELCKLNKFNTEENVRVYFYNSLPLGLKGVCLVPDMRPSSLHSIYILINYHTDFREKHYIFYYIFYDVYYYCHYLIISSALIFFCKAQSSLNYLDFRAFFSFKDTFSYNAIWLHLRLLIQLVLLNKLNGNDVFEFLESS